MNHTNPVPVVLKRYMQQYGLNQESLAKLTGLSQPRLSSYLLGKSKPGYIACRTLMTALDIPPHEFFNLDT